MTPHEDMAAALLAPGLPCPRGLRAWNGSDPGGRFDVHRNNVASSLVGALADTFPVVHALVGDAFFRAMAGVFLRRQPPSSPLLVRYGEQFADFIDAFEPAASLPYLGDVARLEMARLQALHAADAPPLAASEAAAAAGTGACIEKLCFSMHPSVRLLGSAHAVVSIWAAHQGHGDLAGLDVTQGESALVVRPELDVLVIPCDAGTLAFALALQCGCDFGQGAGRAAAVAPGFDLSAALQLLLANGAITSIHAQKDTAS